MAKTLPLVLLACLIVWAPSGVAELPLTVEQGQKRAARPARIQAFTEEIESGVLSDRALTRAYWERGWSYLGQRDYDLAIADFTAILALDDEDIPTLLARANTYYLKGDDQKALADYDAVTAIDPLDVAAMIGRGNLLSAKGDEDGALQQYSKAIDRDPASGNAFHNRAGIYLRKKNYDAAIADFSEAIVWNKRAPYEYFSRGVAYTVMGDHRRAVADYSEAIRRAPKDPRYPRYRCRSRAVLGELDAALEDCEASLRLGAPNNEAIADRGFVHLRAGRLPEAIADFREAVVVDQKSAEAHYGLAVALRRAGQDEESDREASRALELDAEVAALFARDGVPMKTDGAPPTD